MSTNKFEDHLWREFVREHGDDLAQLSREVAGRSLRRPRLVAGAGLGLAGGAAALTLVLTATSATPAFAVTGNDNGTVTVTIKGTSGIAGANAKLRELGIRARVATTAPTGCTNIVQPAAPATAAGGTGTTAQWTINPSSVTAKQTLVLTPASAGHGSSGSIGTRGQVWTCTNVVIPETPPPA
jgi:hypothetical protein